MALIKPERLTSAERLFLGSALVTCYFTADNEEGEEEYYFVALPGDKIEAFNELLATQKLSLEKVMEMGKIVASGLVPPSEDVLEWMKRHYRLNPELIRNLVGETV